MADNKQNTFLDLKNRIFEKAAEINSYSASSIPLSSDSERETFLAIYSSVISSRDEASTAFNNLMTKFVNIYETLFSLAYADLYFRKLYKDLEFINNSIRVMILTGNNNTIDNIYQLNKMLNLLIQSNSSLDAETRKLFVKTIKEQKSFFENIKSTIDQYLTEDGNGETTVAKNTSYGYFYTCLKDLISSIDNVSTGTDQTSVRNNTTAYQYLYKMNESIGKFNEGLELIISEAAQHAFDCLYSWQYIESSRESLDSYYYSEFLTDLNDQIDEFTSTLERVSSINSTNITSTDTEDIRMKMLSQSQGILSSIISLTYDCLEVIKLIRTEKENYESILPLTADYGNFIVESITTIEEILGQDVEPVTTQEDIMVDSTVSEVFGDQSAVASFQGSQFIKPYYILASDEAKKTYNFASWDSDFLIITGTTDQIENEVLLFLSSFLYHFIPNLSDSEAAPSNFDVYNDMKNIGVESILEKELIPISDGNSMPKFKRYKELRTKEKNLTRNYSLKVTSSFENDQIASELKLIFPELYRLSYLKYEKLIRYYSGENRSVMTAADFNKSEYNIKFLIYKALMVSSDRSAAMERVSQYLSENCFESIKTCYLKHLILECISDFGGTSYTRTNDNTIAIMRDFLEVYDNFYSSDADLLSFISETSFYKFINNIKTPDNPDAILPEIPTSSTSLLSVLIRNTYYQSNLQNTITAIREALDITTS